MKKLNKSMNILKDNLKFKYQICSLIPLSNFCNFLEKFKWDILCFPERKNLQKQ